MKRTEKADMPRPIGVSHQIAFVLAERDMSDAPTLGDLCDVLGLRTGFAIGERLREARCYYNYAIIHFETGSGKDKQHRYFMPLEARESVRNKPEFQQWKAQRNGVAA